MPVKKCLCAEHAQELLEQLQKANEMAKLIRECCDQKAAPSRDQKDRTNAATRAFAARMSEGVGEPMYVRSSKPKPASAKKMTKKQANAFAARMASGGGVEEHPEEQRARRSTRK